MPKSCIQLQLHTALLFTLYKAKARAPRAERRAEPRIASFTYCLPSFRLLEPLALTFILRALHNKAFY